ARGGVVMNGVHDMGGMHSLGKVEPEKDEPPFHAGWEGRVLAMQRAMTFTGEWNIDMLRRFQGPGNASRKPETTVTEATTAGRGDNCGEVHNGRGRVGPRGLTKSSPLLH